MLEPFKDLLKSQRIILASASPRRKEILGNNLGLNVEVIPSNFAEDLDKSLFNSPIDYVLENSRQKAISVAKRLQNGKFLVLIGADTVVTLDNKIYEKPSDDADAKKMLAELSGKTHKVYTGVSLVNIQDEKLKIHSFYEETSVTFASLSDEIIKAYVNTKDPLDKAGAYGIQGIGCSLVQSISGDYFNVMGFPAYKFTGELIKFLNFVK